MEDVNILKALPHRFPFLMVDKILEINTDESVVGVKNISMNEPWVQGHFPGEPIFPGALIIEAMAQVSGFIFYRDGIEENSLKGYLCKVDKVKFISKVVPGDSLVVEGRCLSKMGNFAKVKCAAKVNGKVVASGELSYAFS